MAEGFNPGAALGAQTRLHKQFQKVALEEEHPKIDFLFFLEHFVCGDKSPQAAVKKAVFFRPSFLQ